MEKLIPCTFMTTYRKIMACRPYFVFLAGLLLTVLSTSLATAQEPVSPPWEQEIRVAIDTALVNTKIPGLVVVVADSSGIIISEAMGMASLTGPTPMTRSTMMRMGVFGDLGINLALLRLSDMGKLDLDAPISQYTDVHPALGRVTANQLIDHKAGLRANHFTQPLWEDADLLKQVQSWDEDIFVAEPGETRSHSHYSIALAGYLVESLVGKPFPDAMRELVWDPMGAPTATTRIHDLLMLPIGQGYWVQNGEAQLIEPLGAGFIGWPNSLFASLDDLDRIALALADPAIGSRLRGERASSSVWVAGTGWAGIRITAIVDPERQFSALVADNAAEGGPGARGIAQAIWQDVLGQELSPPPPKITWTTVSPDAHEQLIGVYVNETTLEISVRDGKLMMKGGESMEEIMQGGENLFRAPIKIVQEYPARMSSFSVEDTVDGKARLLRIGSRVWGRVDE